MLKGKDFIAMQRYVKVLRIFHCKNCRVNQPQASFHFEKLIAPIPNGLCNTTLVLQTGNFAIRWKSSTKRPQKGRYDDESSSSSDEDEDAAEPRVPGMKLMKTSLASLRVDAVLKSGLGTSRNKIEDAFYESRLRLNGERILKKSYQVEEGDEIDLVHGPSSLNPNFLEISRVQVVGIKPPKEASGRFAAQLHVFRRLTVENYADPWKTGAGSHEHSS